MLIVDTSKTQKTEDIKKSNRNASKFFLPYWSWSEIETCKYKLYVPYQVSLLSELFNSIRHDKMRNRNRRET